MALLYYYWTNDIEYEFPYTASSSKINHLEKEDLL